MAVIVVVIIRHVKGDGASLLIKKIVIIRNLGEISSVK